MLLPEKDNHLQPFSQLDTAVCLGILLLRKRHFLLSRAKINQQLLGGVRCLHQVSQKLPTLFSREQPGGELKPLPRTSVVGVFLDVAG